MIQLKYQRGFVMPKKLPPTKTDRDLNLATLSNLFVDEEKARKVLDVVGDFIRNLADGLP